MPVFELKVHIDENIDLTPREAENEVISRISRKDEFEVVDSDEYPYALDTQDNLVVVKLETDDKLSKTKQELISMFVATKPSMAHNIQVEERPG